MNRFQTPARPLTPGVSLALRAVARAVHERQVGWIPPPPVAGNTNTVAATLGRALGGDAAPPPADFLLDHEQVSNATHLAFHGSGRLPTDADERVRAASVQACMDGFRRSWVQTVRGQHEGEVTARFDALNYLGEAWDGLQCIRGSIPDAPRHLDSLRQAARAIRPVHQELAAGMQAILSGHGEDSLYGSDTLRGGLSARTRVPEVLRDLAQRCRDAAQGDPRRLPARLRIEVDLEPIASPADVALVLDEVAHALETSESLTLAAGLVADACRLLQPCALRLYLEDLLEKGAAVQRRIFDERDDNAPPLIHMALT